MINRVGDALSTPDQQELYELAEQKLVAASRESKLKQQAEENTKAMLIGMFNAVGIKATFPDDDVTD